MEQRFCQCPGCGGCGITAGRHEALFEYNGRGPIKCPACASPGQARHGATAPVERLSQPPGGRTAMSNRRLSERMQMTPGIKRSYTLQEFQAMQRDAELLEQRAAAADRAEAQLSAILTVSEPDLYGPGSPNSYFRDLAAASALGDSTMKLQGGRKGAEERLGAHERFEHRRAGRQLHEMRAQAETMTEAAITGTRREAAIYTAWRSAGGELFEHQAEMREVERRGMSRVDGQGGYFTVPGWISDLFISPRAGAPLAALWTRLPLPAGVSSVSIPRLPTGQGTGTGMQVADVAPAVIRDPADNFARGTVLTLAANLDVSAPWLDQAPLGIDHTLGRDLLEDFSCQLDGQLLLGSGVNGQLPGIIPAGAFSAASMVWLQDTNNTAAQTWANGGGASASIAGSVHQMTAQLASKIAYYRAQPATHWVMPESVWDIASGSGVDAQTRPLVLPGMHPVDAVPMLHGKPIVFDENIVRTFGGTTPPTMGAVSAGRTSPTDGNGTWVPILCGRWQDALYFQSEPVIQLMDEVLSGSLQVRFQARTYIAAIPNRVVNGGSNVTFSATNQGGGVNNGAPVSFGALTNFVSNSILQPTSAGF